MTKYFKKPHTTIFTGQMGCGKTHLVLELIDKEYNKHSDYTVIICPTLREIFTYHAKEWIKTDDQIWLIDPEDNLYQWIQKLSQLLRFLEVLFTIDDTSLTKILIREYSPCYNYLSQGDIDVIIYGY